MEPKEVVRSSVDSFTIRRRDLQDTQVPTKFALRTLPFNTSTPDTFVEEPWRDFETIDRIFNNAPGKYKYQPIQGPNSIRLLELLPGDPSEIIRIKLFTAALDADTEFDALSYEWCVPVRLSYHFDAYGIDTIDTELSSWFYILCDGKQMEIMKNLHRVLLKLRHRFKSLIIWADGICINQEDEAEKPKQLMLMGKIYSQAKTVLCWIGEEKQNTQSAFRIISGIASSFHTKFKGTRESFNAGPAPEIIIDGELVDEMKGDGWLAVVDVFTRPYFGRIWVVQEVVLAQKATIICGTNQISWFDFLNVSIVVAVVGIRTYRRVEDLDDKREKGQNEPEYVTHKKVEDIVDKTDEEVDLFLSKWHRVREIGRLRDAHTSNSRSLALCLEQLLSHQVTQPMDRVYGMLGMITPNSSYAKNHPIIPNYDKTIQQVYQEATEWAIRDLDSLRILNLCEAPGTNVTRNLPTWVPDLSKGPGQCYSEVDPNSQSSLLSIFSPNSFPIFSGRVMFARAHIVDAVVVARAPFTFSLKPIFTMQHFKENAYRLLEQREPIYPTGCTKLDAFWRTLIGNRVETTVKGKKYILKPPPGFDKNFMKHNAMEFIFNWGLPLKLTGQERDLWDLTLDRAPFSLEEMYPEEVEKNISILALMERQPFVKWMYRCAKEGDEAQWRAQFHHRRWLCNGDYGRQFFFTQKGWMGIGHPCRVLNVGNGNINVAEGSGVKAGDVVAILDGSEKVWTLRNHGTGVYTIVGQAYVYGLSEGMGFDPKNLPEMKMIKIM